jgi:chromosome segregation ATPase
MAKKKEDRAEQQLDRVETKVNQVEQRLERVETKVDQVEQRLERVETKVDQVEQRLDRVETKVDKMDSDVEDLKHGQKRLEGHFEFVIRRIDEYQADNRRHIEMLLEKHFSDKAGQGEGYRANRDRLDDHETRIQKLEAS